MKTQPHSAVAAAELRRQEEARLHNPGSDLPLPLEDRKSAADNRRLLHELQVHQVELEMQNDELRQTRERLQTALENLVDLYDFAPVGYFTLTAAGVIRQVNLFGSHLVGIDRSRLVGQTFGRLVTAAQRPGFDSFLQQVFAGEAKSFVDIELSKPDRVLQVVRLRGTCSPKAPECRVVAVNITELKREEEKLRVSEIRYRRLFEAAQDGVLLLDPGTCRITDANPFMSKLLGYSRAQLVGRELFEIGLLKDKIESQEMFQRLKRQHEVRYEDLPLKSQAGRRQEVEVVANLYQEDGHTAIQCNIRDITERKAAARELAEKARLLDLSHDAIIVRDMKGHIRYWNHGAEELYGWSRQEAFGKLSHVLLQTEFPVPLRQMTAELYRTDRWTGELVHTRRDGRRITVLARKTLDRDKQGHPASVLETITDITERKQAEEAQRRVEVLAATNRKLHEEIMRRQVVEASLKESEQYQRDLLARSRQMQEQLRQLSHGILHAQEEERRRISRELHDVIAQTLTGINIRLAALKLEAGRNLKGFDRNINRTQRLVEKSVNLVHVFARDLRPAVLDDLGLIPALRTFVKSFSEQTHLHVDLQVFAGLEQLDIARRTVLFRVAQEALTNVARHAQAGRVEVNLVQIRGGIGLTIKDDGKAFDVDKTSPANGGKRLGLLGMRERVEMVGGCLHIESVRGQGTTILVQMPRHVAKPGVVRKLSAAQG